MRVNSVNNFQHYLLELYPIRFGFIALADYAHSKGLLFGIYSDAGYLTCARRPGSLGNVQFKT